MQLRPEATGGCCPGVEVPVDPGELVTVLTGSEDLGGADVVADRPDQQFVLPVTGDVHQRELEISGEMAVRTSHHVVLEIRDVQPLGDRAIRVGGRLRGAVRALGTGGTAVGPTRGEHQDGTRHRRSTPEGTPNITVHDPLPSFTYQNCCPICILPRMSLTITPVFPVSPTIPSSRLRDLLQVATHETTM